MMSAFHGFFDNLVTTLVFAASSGLIFGSFLVVTFAAEHHLQSKRGRDAKSKGYSWKRRGIFLGLMVNAVIFLIVLTMFSEFFDNGTDAVIFCLGAIVVSVSFFWTVAGLAELSSVERKAGG